MHSISTSKVINHINECSTQIANNYSTIEQQYLKRRLKICSTTVNDLKQANKDITRSFLQAYLKSNHHLLQEQRHANNHYMTYLFK